MIAWLQRLNILFPKLIAQAYIREHDPVLLKYNAHNLYSSTLLVSSTSATIGSSTDKTGELN